AEASAIIRDRISSTSIAGRSATGSADVRAGAARPRPSTRKTEPVVVAVCLKLHRQTSSGRRDAWHHPDYYSDPAADRRAAELALQRWLGLLPERRGRADPVDRHHPAGRRPNITGGISEPDLGRGALAA